MIGAIIMVHGDDFGLILPPKIAPTQVAIVLATDDNETIDVANKIKGKLDSANITSYIDNTDKSFGYKLAEAEVNGIPVRIEIGKRDLANKNITISRRDTLTKEQISLDTDITSYVINLMDDIQKNLYNRALKRRDSMTYHVNSMKEIEEIMNTQPGFIYAPWCGKESCELKMKEIKGLKSRCITEDNNTLVCPVCGEKSKHIVVWGIQY